MSELEYLSIIYGGTETHDKELGTASMVYIRIQLRESDCLLYVLHFP